MGEDGDLERLLGAGGEVLADKGPKSREGSDSGVGGKATLEDATNAITHEVWVRGVVEFLGGQHAFEGKELVVRVLEVRRDVVTFV